MIENPEYRSMITVDQKLLDEYKNPNIDIEKSIFDGKRNKSFLFLLPLTGFDMKRFSNHFVNCFADSKDKKANLNRAIYLLCDDDEDTRNHIKSLPNYIYNYYVGHGDKKYFMYVLIGNEDYDNIVKGNYSLVSKTSKQIIVNYTFDTNPTLIRLSKSNITRNSQYKAVVDGVLNKQEWVRKQISNRTGTEISKDQEYWSPFDNKEIYDSKLDIT